MLYIKQYFQNLSIFSQRVAVSSRMGNLNNA